MNDSDRTRLDKLEQQMEDIAKDVKQIRAWSNRVEGGRMALLWLFGAAATIVGIVIAALRVVYGGS